MGHIIRGLSLKTSVVAFISARLCHWVVLGSYGSDSSLNPSLNPNCPVELGFKSYMWHISRVYHLKHRLQHLSVLDIDIGWFWGHMVLIQA